MTVQGLTAQQARDFDMQPGEGVLVTNVQVGGVADDAGLRARDVILQINKMPVRNAEELRDIVSKLKPESEVLFLIKRMDQAVGRDRHFVPGSNTSLMPQSFTCPAGDDSRGRHPAGRIFPLSPMPLINRELQPTSAIRFCGFVVRSA